MSDVSWIAADWGTSNLRIWALDADDNVLLSRSSAKGMSKLEVDQFESALLELISDFLKDKQIIPVVAAGMVGAKQGWKEAPYLNVPCAPASTTTFVETKDPRIEVHILPGVCQKQPANVMRGEETQILGFLKTYPNWNGHLCLPGTHSKWANVDGGLINSFRTFMTGELFAVIKNQTVLKHSITEVEQFSISFEKAIVSALDAPHHLVGNLFSVRANSLLNSTNNADSAATLSGMLIGAELSSMRAELKRASSVKILAPAAISNLYKRALSVAEIEAECIEIEHFTLEGLKSAYQRLKFEGTSERRAVG